MRRGSYAPENWVGILLALLGCVQLTIGCSPDGDSEPRETLAPGHAKFEVPEGFPEPTFEPSNEYDVRRVALGKKLFFDPRLSDRNAISCGTCHVPELGLSDALPLSTLGESAEPLPRHTPSLYNLAWANKGLFWDGGSKNLESLVFGPLTSPREMNQNLEELVLELAADPGYEEDFRDAFDSEIEIGFVAMALAQYVRSLVSADSRYDAFRSGKETLTELELAGLALVETKCASCHSGELFTDHEYHDIGLAREFSEEDERVAFGRGRVTNRPEDVGKFRTPTLRNVELSAPYMHDGRFSSLREVLQFFRSGIVASPNLSPLLRDETSHAIGIPLEDEEIDATVAFLLTLTGKTARIAVTP